jgi:hypothetical protein
MLLTATTKTGQQIAVDFKDYSKIKEDFGNVIMVASCNGKEVTFRGNQISFNKQAQSFCLHLTKNMAKELLNADLPKGKQAAVQIDQENPKQIMQDAVNTKIDAEIASMKESDTVILYAHSGYGMHYRVSSNKLGFEAESKVSSHVKEIMAKYEKKPASELNADVAYKVVMTWAEFQAEQQAVEDGIQERVEAEKQQIQEKFGQAKETGEPVLISQGTFEEESLPKKEQEEESSIAFFQEWAMPDGTTKSNINHAY